MDEEKLSRIGQEIVEKFKIEDLSPQEAYVVLLCLMESVRHVGEHYQNQQEPYQ